MVRVSSPTIIGLLEKEVNVYAVGLVAINNVFEGEMYMVAMIIIVLVTFVLVLLPTHTDNTNAPTQISAFTPTPSIPNTFTLVHKDDGIVEEQEPNGLFHRKKTRDYGEPSAGTWIDPVARSWI